MRVRVCVTSLRDPSAIEKSPRPTFDVNLVVKQAAKRKILSSAVGHIFTTVMEKHLTSIHLNNNDDFSSRCFKECYVIFLMW